MRRLRASSDSVKGGRRKWAGALVAVLLSASSLSACAGDQASDPGTIDPQQGIDVPAGLEGDTRPERMALSATPRNECA
jgi:hypothetical protein